MSSPSQASQVQPRLVIDPTQELEKFDFDSVIKEKWEEGVTKDVEEMDAIMKEMEVLNEDFLIWSHGRNGFQDSKDSEALLVSGEGIYKTEHKQREERGNVARFLASFEEVFKALTTEIEL